MLRQSKYVIGVALLAGVATVSSPALGATTEQSDDNYAITPINFARDLPSIRIDGKGVLPTLSKEEAMDAATSMKTSSLSDDALITEVRGQGVWQDALASIEAKYSAKFVNAGRDSGRAWITLTGEVPEDVKRTVQALPFNVDIRYAAPQNSEQLRSAAGAGLEAIHRLGVRNAGYTVDDESGAITITFKPGDLASSAAELSNVALQAALKANDANLTVPLKVISDAAYNVENYYAGGASLWAFPPPPAFACTSGFGIRDTSKGGTGTITAQHCANQLYWGESKQDDVIVWDRNAPNAGGGQIDLQLHRSKNGEVASANFQATGYSASDRRTVSGARNATKGDQICKFGWGASSGHGYGSKPYYGCARVIATNFCRVVEDINYCGMNEADAGIGNVGDSGGPVFFGSVAIGFVKGGGSSNFLYTQQSRVSYMGAEIITG